MWKVAALISYVGTNYCGWQRQEGSGAAASPSIQGTVEATLLRMTGEDASVVGSGRTDSGVHAAGQVAHFVLKSKEWDLGILQKGFNSILPRDIRVLAMKHVPLEFHSQRSAEKKQYSYYFQQGPAPLPHLEPYSRWIRKRLDLEALQVALNHLKGRHDFKAFQASGAKPGPTVREIFEAQVTWEPIPFPGPAPALAPLSHQELGMVRVRLVGSGFLKQMVRGIAGTLLQIGEGRREPGCIQELLSTLDRSEVGPTAPARALWLERVWYPGLEW